MLAAACAFRRVPAAVVVLAAALWAGLTPAHACFGGDRGAFSVERNDHATWARSRNTAAVTTNLLNKISLVGNCSLRDEKLRDVFADLSAVIGSYVTRAACFDGDQGATIAMRDPHRDFANGKSGAFLFDNLRWKAEAAMKCLDRDLQSDYFGLMSAVLARAAQRN